MRNNNDVSCRVMQQPYNYAYAEHPSTSRIRTNRKACERNDMAVCSCVRLCVYISLNGRERERELCVKAALAGACCDYAIAAVAGA